MDLPLLAAAGFASSWMLLWAASAAIPFVLHFLYRRRQRVVPWAAMQLLLQVVEKEARRVRLEQLLLLLLRTLILLTLALALARPFWEAAEAVVAPEAGPPATTWILAVDVSYSMGYRPADETRLQAAQRRVEEMVTSAGSGDAFALLTIGQPPRAVIGRPTLERELLLSQLRQLTLNDAGGDVRGGLQLAADMAQSAKQDDSLPANVRIVILSDLGRDQWQAAVDGADRKLLQVLAEKYRLEVESFADETISNVAITAMTPTNIRTVAGLPLDVDLTVANFGSTALEKVPLQLALDGQTLATEYVTLEAESSQVVRMSLTPQTAGQAVLTASLPSDRLAVDNTRSYVIDVREEYEMLFVEQEAGDARILALSLRPSATLKQTRNLTTISAIELAATDLSQWQVVVLNDVRNIDSGGMARLERFVRQGGALLCLLGSRTTARSWNQDQGASLLGFELLEPSAVGDWAIDPLGYRSPVVAPFAGFPDAGLLTTPIFQFWQIKRDKGLELSIDLATTTGDPLIVRHRLGKGCAASLLSAPSAGRSEDAWNAMLTWPSMVPLMQQLVQSAMDTGGELNTLVAGQPLVGTQAGERSSELVTITKPDGSSSQVVSEPVTRAGVAPWVYAQTQQSGVYYVRGVAGQQQPYAVNIQATESPLLSVAREQLPQSAEMLPMSMDDVAGLSPVVETSPLFTRSLLCGLGCLLLAESFFAWAMGRRAR